MRSRFSSTLLRGAVYAAAFIAIATSILGAPLAAQQAPTSKPAPGSSLDLAVARNGTLSNAVTSSHFQMEGGSVDIHRQYYRGRGLVAEIAGEHAGNISSSGFGLDMMTAAIGPRYTWSPARHRYQLFAQGMLGFAHGFNSVFPASTGARNAENTLMAKIGGGLSVKLSPHISLRAIQAGWLRTQFSNSTTDLQNSMTLGSGLVFCFPQNPTGNSQPISTATEPRILAEEPEDVCVLPIAWMQECAGNSVKLLVQQMAARPLQQVQNCCTPKPGLEIAICITKTSYFTDINGACEFCKCSYNCRGAHELPNAVCDHAD